MIKTIDEVRKELKEAIWPFDIIILKDWADSTIQECADQAWEHDRCDINSILKVKDQLI